jgi:hypothetical protein
MRRHGHRLRRAALAMLLTAALGAGVLGPPVANATPLRTKMLQIVNRTRTSHGLRPVKINLRLSDDAYQWSRVMLRNDRLYDPPNLAKLLSPYNWDDVGADVVGCGQTLVEVNRLMMTEDFHRSIILHPKLRRVGIGVVTADTKSRCGNGSLWVTEIFYG